MSNTKRMLADEINAEHLAYEAVARVAELVKPYLGEHRLMFWLQDGQPRCVIAPSTSEFDAFAVEYVDHRS